MRTIYLEKAMSTNEYIKENASAFSHLDAVYTMCQTKGRGRLGRTWSADGGIALSVFIKDAKKPILIPLCAAVAVYNAFQKLGIDNLGIKWPNDILADGKKLSGILCEGVKDGYVVGIGVNNRQTMESLKDLELPYATSVGILGYNPLEEEKFVVTCIKELQNALEMPCDELIDLFSNKCVNLGKTVKIIKNGKEVVAKSVAVSSDGGLVVEIDGKNETVVSGEVSVRGIYGYVE
ncbi:MAG: biotin--[Clostridia bacterium]|nr:biotin--[acetyl-CoA-carboxylase] ligase [Clostridia bacterium]